MIIPGLTASSEEYYIVNMVSDALNNKYDVVVYNDRLYHTRDAFSLPDIGYFCNFLFQYFFLAREIIQTLQI